ncbi:MAG: spermidine/putrescine ABC transporter substrate-binding protein [Anaerolineae bacterium]|nr:spermidine/putrescine ABC transporter substrate-binding protein [Anaerolineae bacterium]
MKQRRRLLFILVVGVLLIPSACDHPGKLTEEAGSPLILRNWEGDISAEILEAFQAEYGIEVTYLPYDSQEEAIADLRAGKAADVVVFENQLIPALVADGLLAEIDYHNVPNFKNISANFRDMAYDPENRHAIPYSWGTTALVVRSDLVAQPVTSWADLWDPRYQGKVMSWPLSRYLLGIALKSLGYSLNSENPEEVEAALDKLVELKPHLILHEWEPAVAAPYLVSGEVVIAVGQADDVTAGKEENQAVDYVMPVEGAILWGDNFTIPAASKQKEAAERLINYLLRAEVSARIMNETYYWLPNDAAMPMVDEALRENPAIFPPAGSLYDAEIILPLSAEGEALYEQAWQRFWAAGE